MDINTIEGTLSYTQLLSGLREKYKIVKKGVLKLKKAKTVEKIRMLEEVTAHMHYLEAITKRLIAMATQEAAIIAQTITAQVKTLQINDVKEITKIQMLYDRLINTLESIDKRNLAESNKSQAMTRLDRGVKKQVASMRDSALAIARQSYYSTMQLKAANDNRIKYRKAA